MECHVYHLWLRLETSSDISAVLSQHLACNSWRKWQDSVVLLSMPGDGCAPFRVLKVGSADTIPAQVSNFQEESPVEFARMPVDYYSVTYFEAKRNAVAH